MSIAKAKANAIAITHRSVVGREPQTAILYSTPLCPPLILNCERFFLYEKNYQRQGRTFFWTTMILKFRIWTWLQIFATDGHTLFKTSSTEGSKSVDWETLFHRRDETFIGDNQTLYSTPLWTFLSFFLLKAVFVVPFIDISHLTWCDFQKMSAHQNIFRIEMKPNGYQDKIQNSPKSE